MLWQAKFPFGRLVDVFVTHVDERSGNFFIQINDAEAGNLDQLITDIEQYTKQEPTRMRPADVTIGDMYIVQYVEDEMWYRACVLDVKYHCEVFFVDYGNTEFVHPNCVRKAKEKFLKLPSQAFECKLDGIEKVRGPGFQDFISSLKECILEKELFCRGVSLKKNNISVVNLYTDKAGTTSVINGIMGTGIESRTVNQLYMKYKTITLQTDTFNDLCVTHVQDPGHFWCHLLSNTDGLQVLMDDLATEYSDTPGKFMPDLAGCYVGRPCCAKFAGDDSWYRAAITNVGSLASGLVEVRFVDYGITQKTSLVYVKELKANFLDLPVQAIECMVEGIQPVSGDTNWSVEGMALFSKLIEDKHVVGLVMGQESDSRYQLKLFDTTSEMNLEVNQVMVDAGYAANSGSRLSSLVSSPANKQSHIDSHSKVPITSPVFSVENVQPSVEERVLVSSVDSPSLFYCQLFHNSSKLLQLVKDINQHYLKLSPREELFSSPSPGAPCCAQFSEDGCWYRAIVKQVSPGKAKVHFVDYGNTESLPTMKIKRLLPRFSGLPKQGIECSLNRIRANERSWTKKAIKKFQAMTEGEAKMTVVAIDETGISRVELIVRDCCEEKNASDELLLDGSAQLVEGAQLFSSKHCHEIVALHDYNYLTLTIGQHEDVVVSFTNDPCNFWCQLSRSSKEYNTLMKDVGKYCTNTGSKDTISSPSIGMPCCAQFTVDNLWYRGKITGTKKGNLAEIHFVDYGNSEVLPLSRTCQIQPEFMKLSPQAIRCALINITPPSMHLWSEEVIQHFEELTMDKEFILRADSYDERVGVYSVLLLDTSKSLSAEIAPLLSQKVGVDIPSLVIKEHTPEVSAVKGDIEFLSKKTGGPVTELLRKKGSTASPRVPSFKLNVGEMKMVYITVVEGVSKFYGQVIEMSESFDELMDKLEHYYSSLAEKAEALSIPRVGDFCVAKFTVDQSWYRAKITYVGGNNFEVLYVDYGNMETLPHTSLKVLQPKFVGLPAQAVACSLSGMSGSQPVEVDRKFGELSCDQTCEAHTVSIRPDGVVEVKLYSKSGVSLQDLLSAEKGVAQSSREIQLKPETLKAGHIKVLDGCFASLPAHAVEHDHKNSSIGVGDTFNIFITCIVSPGKWYCQLVDLVSQLNEVRRELNNHYIHLSETEGCLMSPFQRQLCVARYSVDELMYSARVVSLSVNNLAVQFVGYGNSETICPSGVKQIEPGFMDLRVASVDCSLKWSQESWTAKQSALFEELTGQKELTVKLLREKDSRFEVKVYEEGVKCISDAVFQGKPGDPRIDALQQAAEGTPCCTMYLEDGGRNRAEITNVLPDSHLEVIFVDYGNSVLCKLAISKTAYNEVELFQSSDLDKALQATSTVLEEDKWLIKIEEDDGSLFASSQPKKYCKPSLTRGSCAEMLCLYAEFPDCFLLQRTDNIDELNKLMSSIAVDLPKESPPDLAVGLPCLGQFTEDDSWYRAEILAIGEDKTYVQYVDYGNSEWLQLDRLRPIKEEFLSLPVQAIKASWELNKVVDFTNLTEALNASFLERIVHVEVLAQNNDGAYTVRLFETESVHQSVLLEEDTPNDAEEIRSYHQKTKQYKRPELHKGSRMLMYFIAAASSPEHMHLQFADSQNEFATLMSEIADVYSRPNGGQAQLVDPHAGQPCCAQFAEDGQWYRAEIVAAGSEGMLTVNFIDYGNCDVVPSSKVKELGDSFLDLQVQAVECKMSGVCPSPVDQKWSDNRAVKLDELCASKKFSVEFVDVQGFPSVILHDEATGETINQLMMSHGEGDKVCAEPHRYQMLQRLPFSTEHKLGRVIGSHVLQRNAKNRFRVFCTPASSPHSMQRQPKDEQEKLTAIMTSIASVYKAVGDGELEINNPQAGQACCDRFYEDEERYRAQVIDITDSDHIIIKFVDFGNSKIVPIVHVKELNAYFLVLPTQSFTRLLAGTHSASQDGASDEGPADFQDTTKTLKEGIELKEGKQAVTDADTAGEDRGEEFLVAPESVHDVEAEEDLTAITGTTSEDNNGHGITHDSSEEEWDAMVCDRAGNPAPPPSVFIEELHDEVCSSVDTENSEQAEDRDDSTGVKDKCAGEVATQQELSEGQPAGGGVTGATVEQEKFKGGKEDKQEELKPKPEDGIANEESRVVADSKREATQVLSTKGGGKPQPKTNVEEDASKVQVVVEECKRKTEVLSENLGDDEAKPNTEVLNRDGDGAACQSEMGGGFAFKKSITKGECNTLAEENKVDMGIQKNGVHRLDDQRQPSKEVGGDDTIDENERDVIGQVCKTVVVLSKGTLPGRQE